MSDSFEPVPRDVATKLLSMELLLDCAKTIIKRVRGEHVGISMAHVHTDRKPRLFRHCWGSKRATSSRFGSRFSFSTFTSRHNQADHLVIRHNMHSTDDVR
eukprot:scaffold48225_cov83-Cyclotella_meneghiniana.AAC.1